MRFTKAATEDWSVNVGRLWLVLLALLLSLSSCAGDQDENSNKITEEKARELAEQRRERDRIAYEEKLKEIEENYRKRNQELMDDNFGHPRLPCGMSRLGLPSFAYHDHILAWTPDGKRLVFDGGPEAMWVVNNEGTVVRRLFDINPNKNLPYIEGTTLPYGFYAEVSPDGSRIVSGICKSDTGRPIEHYEIAVFDLHSGERSRFSQTMPFSTVTRCGRRTAAASPMLDSWDLVAPTHGSTRWRRTDRTGRTLYLCYVHLAFRRLSQWGKMMRQYRS